MAEIKQTLGFNASEAINNLERLDGIMRSFKSAVSSTTKSLGSFNTKADKTDGVLKRLKTSAGGAADAMGRLNKQSGATKLNSTNAAAQEAVTTLNNLGTAATNTANKVEAGTKKADKSTKDWTVSWKTLARVVATQAVVRALNAIRQALKAVVGDAIDFQRAIAEIGTIDPGNMLGGLDSIGATVREVSDAFNVDLADTAEAAYQAVSNQIVRADGDLERFLGTSAKFAKVTKTDISTAVNLLSGTLNAFGKDASEAEDIAAKFFKTIELGRTRAEELAQGLGTISPIADQLGITIEELNAGVATLTIGGIKTDKAVTQLRGTMQGFLKPTTEMKAAMRELGFATGEQVLEAYNLQDAVLAVTDTTDGSAAAIGKLFPRIRGLTGVMALADDQTGHFNKTLEEQKTALEGTYDRAYKLVVDTDAEKVTKFFREVRNWFVTEIGQRFLSGLVFVLRLDVEGEKSALERLRAANSETLKLQQQQADKRLQINLDRIEKLRQQTAQEAAIARQGFFAAAEAADEANQSIVASSEWAIDSLMGPIDAAVEAIKKASSEGQKLIDGFADSADKSFNKLQDTIFKRGLGQVDDPTEKVSILRKKAAEQALKAQLAAASATTDAELKAADALQASAASYNDQAYAISKSITKKYQDGEAIRDLTERELALQKQQSNNLTQDLVRHTDRYRQATLKGAAAVESNQKSLAESSREIVAYQAKLEGLNKKLIDLQKAATAVELTPGDQEAAKKQAEEVAAEIGRTYEKGIAEFADSPDKLVSGLFEKIQSLDKSVEIETIMQVPDNIGEMHGRIKSAFEQLFASDPVNVQVKFFADKEGRPVETATQLAQETSKYYDRLGKSQKDINAASKSQNQYNSDLKQARDTLAEINKITAKRTRRRSSGVALGGPGGSPGGTRTEIYIKELTEAEKKFNAIHDRITKIASEGPKSINQIAAIGHDLNQLPDSFIKGLRDGQNLYDTLGFLRRAAEVAKSQATNTESAFSEAYSPLLAEQLQAQVQARVDATNAQEQLNNKTKEGTQIAQQAAQQPVAEVPPIAEETDQANQSATQLKMTQSNVTLETQNSAAGIQQMDSNLQQANSSAQTLLGTLGAISGAASTAQGPIIQNPGVDFNRFGGLKYFANGGRGTDTIPAMLSAGEHVTNARSSRRFFSQLQAINAGQQPVYRNEGGDTYNTNVGDIHVSGAGKPAVVAREVMKQIRREERRGSGR